MINIAQHIEEICHRCPNKLALIFERVSISYRELEEMIQRLATVLTHLGISRGDRVALFLPNHPTFVVGTIGIYKLGAIAVCVNPLLKSDEVQFILNNSGATVVITTPELREHLPTDELPQVKHVLIAGNHAVEYLALVEEVNAALPAIKTVAVKADTPAAIFYTSATTGFPKGVVHSHGAINFILHAAAHAFQMQAVDRVLICVPISQTYGLNTGLMSALGVGATVSLHRRFEVDAVVQALTRDYISVFVGVPTIYRRLVGAVSRDQLKSLRFCLSSTAPLPLPLAEQWQAQHGITIRVSFGSTETGLVAFNNQPENYLGSIGRPLAGIEAQIVDAAGQEVAVGQLGEFVVQSPATMLGYWHQAEATSETIRDGWLHTGDLGRMDSDGYIYLVDRIKDVINVNGRNVYPSEVEKVLEQHPVVREAAVIGVPDAQLEERVWAYIVPHAGHSVAVEQIREFCQQRLAYFKVPREVEWIESLPRGRTGKVLKRVLRESVQLDER